jgi:arginine transport system permease protein
MDNINFLTSAAGITVGLSLCSLLIGLTLAMFFAVWESVRFKPVSWLCTAIVTVIRGLPEVLIVLSIYFGLSMLYPLLLDGFTLDLYFFELPIKLNVSDPNANIAPFWCGVIALSLLYASYGSQTLRGAIKAVPYGQWESGFALGLGKLAIFYRLIMPQMWKHALPGLGNQWLVLLKDTALVSLIGVNDIMRQTEAIISHTKQPFNWYLIAALLYLAITLVSQFLLKRFELRTTRFERRNG